MPEEKIKIKSYEPHGPQGPLIHAVGNLAAGETHMPEAGRILTGIYSADADVTSLVLEILVIAWEPYASDEGTAWVGVANSIVAVRHLACDGVRIRMRNSHGANQIDAIYYTYETCR